ncbi:MAG: GFA family protein [Paracoccaceae bacterium]
MNDRTHRNEGGCTCGHVRYQVVTEPLIVHGCHCRGCQKNSGSAFAINALFEADRVELLSGTVEDITVPTPSGTGQDITRCAKCRVAVWSNYNMGGLRKNIRFIRVGTLDDPDQFPPDVHIYAASKQPWVILPKRDRRFEAFYRFAETWSPASLKRLAKIEERAGIKIS